MILYVQPPHFINEETSLEGLNDIPKVIWLVSTELGLESKATVFSPNEF